jgi:aconitase B
MEAWLADPKLLGRTPKYAAVIEIDLADATSRSWPARTTRTT